MSRRTFADMEYEGKKKQTRKRRQRHFGMEAHIGMDAGTGPAHSAAATGANAADVTQVGRLPHGTEEPRRSANFPCSRQRFSRLG